MFNFSSLSVIIKEYWEPGNAHATHHTFVCISFITHPTLPSQVDSREEVSELLSLHDQIDLVIPRGGNSLVRSILEQVQGKIPVLGHADGICHVYLDKDADLSKALNVGE